MLQLASSPLTPDYSNELWALPAGESVNVSPREAYTDYDAVHTPRQGEGR